MGTTLSESITMNFKYLQEVFKLTEEEINELVQVYGCKATDNVMLAKFHTERLALFIKNTQEMSPEEKKMMSQVLVECFEIKGEYLLVKDVRVNTMNKRNISLLCTIKGFTDYERWHAVNPGKQRKGMMRLMSSYCDIY